MRSLDLFYAVVTTIVVAGGFFIVILIEYFKYLKWSKAMDERPEAEPYTEVDGVQLTKRQVKLFNRVYQNAKAQNDAMFRKQVGAK
jgi:hypothetical protein